MKAASTPAGVAPVGSASGSSAGITGATDWPAEEGEVVVHRMRGDAVRQRRKLRRGAERLPDDRWHCGADPSAFTISATM